MQRIDPPSHYAPHLDVAPQHIRGSVPADWPDELQRPPRPPRRQLRCHPPHSPRPPRIRPAQPPRRLRQPPPSRLHRTDHGSPPDHRHRTRRRRKVEQGRPRIPLYVVRIRTPLARTRPPPRDRSDDPPDSWRGEGERYFEPEVNDRVEAICDRIARLSRTRSRPLCTPWRSKPGPALGSDSSIV